MTNDQTGSAPVLVIGAGLSGLMAARDLAASGRSVRVVDKGRSVGGRLATRRIGRATLDHGAQFFTVRSDTLRAEVEAWLDAGVVEVWCEGFGEIDGYPRYRTVGGMSQLAKHLTREVEAAGVETICGVRAQSIIPGGDRWVVSYDGAVREPDEASAVITSAPVPQGLELLASGGVSLSPDHAGLADIAYHKVLALLVTTTKPASLPSPGALQQPDDPTFSFIADNQAKSISAEPAITFHTAHRLSSELWPQSDAGVRDALATKAAAAVGLTVDDFAEVHVKRWRYSGPINPWPERAAVVRTAPAPLVFCGDAFGGPKVEGAYLSGRAAATAVSTA